MAASCPWLVRLPILCKSSPNIAKSLPLSQFLPWKATRRDYSSLRQLNERRTNCLQARYTNVNSAVLSSAVQFLKSAVSATTTTCRRHFSNDSEGQDRDGVRKIKPVFVAIPNPFKIVRNKIYFWMIRAYFDAEFSAEDFIDGAKQALCMISESISEGNFDKLEGLLSGKLLEEVKETCAGLALRDRSGILITMEDVLHVFPQNVAVHYDEKGGKFLNILMRFWCHSTASEESDKGVVGLRFGSPPPGMSEEEFKNMGSVISCTYEFHRDFSAGISPTWTVTYIQHGKWLNSEARWLPKEWS